MALKIEDIGVPVGTALDKAEQSRIGNSLFYSEQLGVSPDVTFNLEPELNIEYFGKEVITAEPGKMLKDSFLQSLADKPAMALKGVQVYTPGKAFGIDPLLDKASTLIESLKDPELEKKLQQVASGKLWPIGDDKRWWQVELKYLPEVINAWAVNVGDQIPLMLTTFAGRAAGGVIGKPISKVAGAVFALITGGPDPSDVVTAPAVVAITQAVVKHLGGAAPLVAIEAASFMDDAEALGIDHDIKEKYARLYGLGSGTIEYAQQLWLLGRYNKIAKPAQTTILKQVLSHLGGSAFEGLEEISQGGLENFLLQKAVAEMKERHPDYDKKAPAITEGWKRNGTIGAGVAFITGLPGTGMSIGKGQVARMMEAKPETKKFLGEPSVQEVQKAEESIAVEKPTEVPIKPAVEPTVTPVEPKAKPVEKVEEPERVAEEKEAKRVLDVEAAEEIAPRLYIGKVTEGMKKRIEEGTGFSADDIKGFTEEGFPTIRTAIKMTKGEAEIYLDFLENKLLDDLENNRIRTENDLAKANAEWGDIKNLREILGLEKVKRPFSVIRAEKHKIKVIENVKSRIREAIRPTIESKMTVGEVLSTVLRRSARAAKMGRVSGRRELRAEIRAKKRAKVRLTKALKKVKQDIPKTVDFFFRETIEALRSGIDLAFRSEKTLGQRRSTAEFIKRVPEGRKDIPVKLLKQIQQKSLNDFTIEELENLASEIDKLIQQGKLKRKLKLKPILEERKKTIGELTENTEKVKPTRVKTGPKVASTTEQGLMITVFDKIKAWTWTPQRLFDMLDGGENFAGAWLRVFYDDTKTVKRKFLERKRTRKSAALTEMKRLNLTTWYLSGSRIVGGIKYNIQEMMGIYMAKQNRLSKLVLRYGHELSDSDINNVTKALTKEEKALADFLMADYEKNYSRLRKSTIEQENRDPGKEERYSPIKRVGDFGKTLESEIVSALLRREQLSRHNVAHGFTLERKNVPKELQTPMRLDAVNVWMDQVEKQERYIAIGPQVRRMNKILANKALRKTVGDRFGRSILKTLDGYVSSVANPYIYKQFSDPERASAYLRRNTAMAYLGFNLVTMGKQLPSVLLYLPDAGPSHLLASAFEFATSPMETIKKVRGLDPQLAERSLERELEELKNLPNANFIKSKIGKFGMEGIYLFDTIARTIGWNAVYESALTADKSPAEAVRLAQNSTLRTQPAAAAEDIPALYRTNEFLNWFTMFTNQLNKIFNIATYDIPSYLRNEEYAKAALQAMGMSIVALTIWVVTNRKLPEEPEEFAEAISEQALNMIPVFGKPIMAARKGWDSDIPLFEGVRGLAKATTDLELTRSDTRSMAEGIAVTTGIPYTAIRRTVQAIEEEQPTALLGSRRPTGSRGRRRTTRRST